MSNFFKDNSLFKPKTRSSLFTASNHAGNINLKLQKPNQVQVHPQVDEFKNQPQESIEGRQSVGLSVIEEGNSSAEDPPFENDFSLGEITNQLDSPITVNSNSDASISNKVVQNNDPDQTDEDGEDEDDDDDLEITDVRPIMANPLSHLDTNTPKSQGTPTPSQRSRASTKTIEEDNCQQQMINKEVQFHSNKLTTTHPIGKENKYDQVSMQYLLNTISHINKSKEDLENKLKTNETKLSETTAKLNTNERAVLTLKNRVKQLSSTLVQCNREVKIWHQKASTVTSNSFEVVKEVKQLKTAIVELDKQLEGSKKRFESFKNRLATSNGEITKKEIEISSLKSRLDDVSGRLSEEKIKNNQLSKTLDDSRIKFENEALTEFRKNSEILNDLLAVNQQIKTEFDDKLSILSQNATTSRTDSKDDMNKLIELVNTNFNSLITKFETSDEKIKSLLSSTTVSQKHCASLVNSLATNSAKSFNELQTSVEASNSNLIQLSTDSKQYVNIENMKQTIESIKAIDDKLETKKQLEKESKSKIDEILLKYNESTIAHKSLLETFNKEKEKLEECQKLFVQLEKEKSDLNYEKCSLIKECQSLSNKCKNQTEELKEIQKSFEDERQGLVKSFESKLRTQEELLKLSKSENEKLKLSIDKEFNKSKKHVEQLTKKLVILDELSTENKYLKKDIKDFEKRIKNNETELEKRQLQIKEGEKQILTCNSNKDSELESQSLKIEKLIEENQKLIDQNASLEKFMKEKEMILSNKAEKDATEKDRKLTELSTKNSELTNKLNLKSSTIESLEKEIKSWKSKSESTGSTLKDKCIEINKLDNNLKINETRIKSLEVKLKEGELKIKEMEELIKSKNQVKRSTGSVKPPAPHALPIQPPVKSGTPPVKSKKNTLIPAVSTTKKKEQKRKLINSQSQDESTITRKSNPVKKAKKKLVVDDYDDYNDDDFLLFDLADNSEEIGGLSQIIGRSSAATGTTSTVKQSPVAYKRRKL